ncbi:hypothetical protein VaNZ11_004329 [Volvox africanus]|uniref:3-deoxy-D-manno-octulosonic-acid transferase N-terminal domain-containing protein n=1 Tax=Volvox africanus TaxID=51714 RepID=A0ABQ5RWB1_9CHLO|nr:hypothetical protein VaNZ11_004329 [Volvox africanus]
MKRNNFLAYIRGVAKLPGSLAYLALRLLHNQETIGTALQRLGWSSIERRNGPVLWFNVNHLGETSTFLPVVFRCLQEYNEKVTILVTTPCLDVYKLLGGSLPHRVLVQLVPLENPITIAAFLRKWQPQVGVFLETPFHREFAFLARDSGVRLALLNAHMPGEDMLEWHARHTSREVLKQTVSLYSLIVPRTYIDVGRFRMFGATLGQMPGWSTDLQQASELGACAARLLTQRPRIHRPLLKRLAGRQLWIATNTLPGEDVVVARIHAALRSRHTGLLTIVSPSMPKTSNARVLAESSCSSYAAAVRRLSLERRLQVELLSTAIDDPKRLSADVDMLVLDDPGTLAAFYSLSEIVLVGGSLLPSLDGASSPAAAAVAGCALLMGPHGGEYLGLALDLNHAAIVASEEVAAAVAQTGVTTGRIHQGDFNTPREAEGRVSCTPGTPVISPWLSGPGVGPPSGIACAMGSVDAPGAYGRNRPWLTHGATSTIRPMSAPSGPEHFDLRSYNMPYAFLPIGGASDVSSLQASSNGQRNIFIAPFSTPGVSYSWGGTGSPAVTDVSGRPICSDDVAPPSARLAGFRGGITKRRRGALDRFRWDFDRDIAGFGYIPEKDYAVSDSASSTCGSEEDHLGRGVGESALLVESVAPTVSDIPNAEGDAGGTMLAANQQATAATHNVCSIAPSSLGQVVFLGEQTAQKAPGSPRPAQDILSVEPVTVVLPTHTMGLVVDSTGSFNSSADSLSSPSRASLTDRSNPAARSTTACDEAVASDRDDGDFHDAIDVSDVDVDPGLLVSSLSHSGVIHSNANTPRSDPGDKLPATSIVTPLLATPEHSNNAWDEDVAVDVANALNIGAEVVWTTEAMEVVPGEAAVEDRPLLQTVLRSWKQLVATTGCGVPGAKGITINIPAGNGSSEESILPSSTELPVLRGTHLGQSILCREPDISDDVEVHWPSRYAVCEARHLASDPGLPSIPVPGLGDEGGDFFQEWPAPSVKSVIDPAQLSLAQAVHANNTLVPQQLSHGDCGPGQDCAHPDSGCVKSLPYRMLGGLDDITETWASDVSMAAMVESNNYGSSDELAPLLAPSPPISATGTLEASGVLLDSPQASFRGSLDHYLQGLNTSSSSPSTVRGRIGRGAMTRMSVRAPAERSAGEICNNLEGMVDTFATEDGGDESGEDQEGLKASGGDDDLPPGCIIVEDATLDNSNLLPWPPRLAVPYGDGGAAGVIEPADEGGSNELSPTVVSAAVASPISLPDDGFKGSSSTTIVPGSGNDLEASTSYALSGRMRCTADPQALSAAESPRSDFEFGGSVPGNTGSGSPTLLATSSVHNGSGVNLQTFAATDSIAEIGFQHSDAVHASATATPGIARLSNRTSSPSGNNSRSDLSIVVSPPRVAVTVAATRFQSPQHSLSQSVSNKPADNNPYNDGSCFASQMCFRQLSNGSSVSSTTSVASVSSRSSGDLPSFHQVASIGSWLDHFGSMLPQPSIGLQRSQVQHDPVVWFTQQMAQHDGNRGMAATAVALEGVGPGLRAPMNSPLNSFDDNRHMGINLKGLASVTTTLFPAESVAPSCTAHLPSASPTAPSCVAEGGTIAASSSALRSPRSKSSEQVTSEFSIRRAPAAGGALSSLELSHCSVEAPIAGAVAIDSVGPGQCTKRDELSVLLNSPSSPVSPVRVTKFASPGVDRRIIHPSSLASPEGVPGFVQSKPTIRFNNNLLRLPQQRRVEGNNRCITATERAEVEALPLRVALPSSNTAQHELQGQSSLPPQRMFSSPSILRNVSSFAPGAVPDVAPGIAPDGQLDMSAIGATASGKSRGPDSPWTSESSSCPNTPTSRAADNASSPFRGPRDTSHSCVANGCVQQLRSLPLPGSLIASASTDNRSFEESFEVAVRATPKRSQVQSAIGRGSVHVSPYSSPYKSALAATMAPCSNPSPGTPFRSLFLEEEEELLGAQLCEDPMPLSPRANSLNVLFSMQTMNDKAASPGSVQVTSCDSDFRDLASNLVFAGTAAPLWPLKPALPSAANTTTCQRPSNSYGANTAMMVPVPGSSFADSGLEAVDYDQQTAKIQGMAAVDEPTQKSGSNMASLIPDSPHCMLPASTPESAATPDGQRITGLLGAKPELLSMLSCISSLADRADDSDGSASALPARAVTHLSEPNRQPRITLSGGLLDVPVVGASCGRMPKSNLSQISTPRQEDELEGLAGGPSMGPPSISDTMAGALHETQLQTPQPGSGSVIFSSMTTICPASKDDSIESSLGTFVAGCMAGGHGSAGSLASSVAVASRQESPPRSPAERTACPRCSCPSASPVKPPMQSVQSPLIPRSLATDGPQNQSLLHMPAPLSNPSAYPSPGASEPQVTPMKIVTSVKRTPTGAILGAADDLLQMPKLRSPSGRAGAVATSAFFGLSSSCSTAGLAESTFPRDRITSPPSQLSPAAVPSFGGMAPVRTQPLIVVPVGPTGPSASASAGQVPDPLPRHFGPCQAARHLWPPASSGGGGHDDEPLLATHASCPAGFVALSNRGLPPTPRSGRRDMTFSPSDGASAQSHDLYTQRSQQQQMWDRARAESRNASAAGTPRSARALFGTSQLPVSFSSTNCGYMEMCVSPVNAPRSPRVAASPAQPPIFAQSAVTSGTSGSSFVHDNYEGQSWRLQQARTMYQAVRGRDTNQLGKALQPPASPRASTSIANQSSFSVEPSSPSWSQVSRRLFPDVNSLGGAAATGSTVGIATLHRRSVDQLDEVLAHMKVQVASPVSPQPRPLSLSPRLLSGGNGLTETMASMGVATASTSSTGYRRPSMRAPSSKAVSSEQDATGVSPRSGMTSQTSVLDSGPGAFSSSIAATHLHCSQYSRDLVSDSGSHLPVAPMLPYLPPLPPLPRLRNLPRLPMVGPGVSSVDAMPAITTWPCLPLPLSNGGTSESGRDVVDMGRHRPYRQSAPELSQIFGPLLNGNPTRSSFIRDMSAAAEQDALMALESQFKAAEREAADLPIETRVATPTTLPQAVANSYALAKGDVAPAGLPVGGFGPAVVDAPLAGSLSDSYTVSQVAPPSPCAITASAAPPSIAVMRGLGINTTSGACGNLGGDGASRTTDRRVEVKPQAHASELFAETSVGNGVAQHQGQVDGGDRSMTNADLRPLEHGATVSDTKERCPSTLCTVHDSLAPHPNGKASGRSGSQCQQERSDHPQRGAPRDVAAPWGSLRWTAHAQGSSTTVTTPAETRGDPTGFTRSPAGSISGDLHIAPCARYMGQYLVPAAQMTADPRMGPAVWIVSNEDELVGALSKLLHDTVERQSRGRAAAQGAAKLASSLVTTVWNVLEDMVIAPALQDYIASRGARVPT